MSAIIPTTILDNFFKKPKNIIDFAKTLEYKPDEDHYWPGKRSDCLSLIHPPLYKHINNKVLSLFFEGNQFEVDSSLRFQIIENDEDTGWIHQDSCLFTYMVYLSPDNEINRGTSLYKLKDSKNHFLNNKNDFNLNTNIRKNHHITKKISKNDKNLKNKWENDTFDKTLDVKDNFNRFIAFSSEHFHSANNLNNNSSPRLTLIGFVHKVQNKNIFPITRFLQAQYW